MCKSLSMTSEPFLTSSQACGILGISLATLTRWVASGRVEAAQKLPGKTGAFLFAAGEIERERADRAERQKVTASP